LHEVLSNQTTLLGQGIIKPTTQQSIMQRRNVSHSVVGMTCGHAMPGSDRGLKFEMCSKSCSTQTLLLSHFVQFQTANFKKSDRQGRI